MVAIIDQIIEKLKWVDASFSSFGYAAPDEVRGSRRLV
jgi:hypothetical protein